MRFAYNPTMCDPSEYLTLARTAENHSFDAMTFPDSICYPKDSDSKHPYREDAKREALNGVPFVEPFCAISAVAAVTERLTFSTSIVKLPVRQPVLVAKQASTVAVLSNNRFVFGVGIGPWRDEYTICGERWEDRGRRMDEMIDIIRGLLSGDYFSYDGEFYQMPACKLCPVPSKSIPLIIGGHSEQALRRAASRGDGWIGAGADYNELKKLIDRINELRVEYGTDKQPFQIHVSSQEACSVDGVKRLQELGVTECIIGFRNIYAGETDQSLQQKVDAIKQYSDEIISRAI